MVGMQRSARSIITMANTKHVPNSAFASLATFSFFVPAVVFYFCLHCIIMLEKWIWVDSSVTIQTGIQLHVDHLSHSNRRMGNVNLGNINCWVHVFIVSILPLKLDSWRDLSLYLNSHRLTQIISYLVNALGDWSGWCHDDMYRWIVMWSLWVTVTSQTTGCTMTWNCKTQEEKCKLSCFEVRCGWMQVHKRRTGMSH